MSDFSILIGKDNFIPTFEKALNEALKLKMDFIPKRDLEILKDMISHEEVVLSNPYTEADLLIQIEKLKEKNEQLSSDLETYYDSRESLENTVEELNETIADLQQKLAVCSDERDEYLERLK